MVQSGNAEEQTPGLLRAGAYVLLFSGIFLALIVGVVGTAVLIADLNGTFEQLSVLKQVHGH